MSRRGRQRAQFPPMSDAERKADVERRNALDRIRFPRLPDPPPEAHYKQELDRACVSLKAIAETLKLRPPTPSRECELLAAATAICSPFRTLITCGHEHCRGLEAAIVAKSPSGDNLYWMGGKTFCASDPRCLGNERHMDAAKTAKTWRALDVVLEFYARLEKANEIQKTAAGAAQSLAQPEIP